MADPVANDLGHIAILDFINSSKQDNVVIKKLFKLDGN